MRGQKFKGRRDYLHSTTILQGIHSTLGIDPANCRKIDFSCRKLTNRLCRLATFPEAPPADRDIVAEYRDADHHVLVIEGEERISQRVPCPEAEIISRCRLDGRSATIAEPASDHSAFDCLIAACKHLLFHIFPGHTGQFVFIRAQLDSMPRFPVTVAFHRMISNRYYQAIVSSAGAKDGMIIFGERHDDRH